MTEIEQLNAVKINRLLICLPTIQGNEAEGFIRADTSVLRKCLYCVYTLGQKSSGIFFKFQGLFIIKDEPEFESVMFTWKIIRHHT